MRKRPCWREWTGWLVSASGFVLRTGTQRGPEVRPGDWVWFGANDWRVVTRLLSGDNHELEGYWVAHSAVLKNFQQEVGSHDPRALASIAEWIMEWVLDPPRISIRGMGNDDSRKMILRRAETLRSWTQALFSAPEAEALGHAVDQLLGLLIAENAVRPGFAQLRAAVDAGQERLDVYLLASGLARSSLSNETIQRIRAERHDLSADQFFMGMMSDPRREFTAPLAKQIEAEPEPRYTGRPDGGVQRKSFESLRSIYGTHLWPEISALTSPEDAIDVLEDIVSPRFLALLPSHRKASLRSGLFDRFGDVIEKWPNETRALPATRALQFLLGAFTDADFPASASELVEVIRELVSPEEDEEIQVPDADSLVDQARRESMNDAITRQIRWQQEHASSDHRFAVNKVNDDEVEELESLIAGDPELANTLDRLRAIDYDEVCDQVGELATLTLTNAMREDSQDYLSCMNQDGLWVYWFSAYDPDISSQINEYENNVNDYVSECRAVLKRRLQLNDKRWEAVLSGRGFDLDSGLWMPVELDLPEPPAPVEGLDIEGCSIVDICSVREEPATLKDIIAMVDSYSPSWFEGVDTDGYGMALTYESDDFSSFWTEIPALEDYYGLIEQFRQQSGMLLRLGHLVP